MQQNQLDAESYLKEDLEFYNEKICDITSSIIPLFEKKMRNHMLLHFIFIFFGAVEVILLLYFLASLVHYAMISIALSGLFLTGFSYFILRLYCQTKKIEQFTELSEQYVSEMKSLLEYHEGIPECHIALANGCCMFAESLKGREYRYYNVAPLFAFLTPFLKKISSFCHWQDLFAMRELLLLTSIEEQIKFVKCEATSLEAHTSLANAYSLLSCFYSSARSKRCEEPFAISNALALASENKARIAAERAIEEFKILSDYSPNDIWVHEQLAYSYRDLKMPLEEINQYEAILRLTPMDVDILYKLGVLYFQLGRNASGLQVYEQLKRLHYTRAENLIAYYGAYQHE